MLPVEMVLASVVPHFYALHTLPPEAGNADPQTGFIMMPPLLNCSSERIERHGAYLLDNGFELFLWISRTTDPNLLAALFERPYDGIPAGKVRRGKGLGHFRALSNLPFCAPQFTLPSLQNAYNQQVNNIISKIRRTRLTMATVYPTLYVVKDDGDPAMRMWFLSHMVEDRTDNAMSYPQYLGQLREAVGKIN